MMLPMLSLNLLLQPITPEAVWQFENALANLLRECGRGILEVVYNRLETGDPDEMPKQVECDRQEYSRKNEKTDNRNGTLFGKIPLVRFSYEPLSEARDDQQKSCSPREQCLGIVAGNATPALGERVGRAASGHTQRESESPSDTT